MREAEKWPAPAPPLHRLCPAPLRPARTPVLAPRPAPYWSRSAQAPPSSRPASPLGALSFSQTRKRRRQNRGRAAGSKFLSFYFKPVSRRPHSQYWSMRLPRTLTSSHSPRLSSKFRCRCERPGALSFAFILALRLVSALSFSAFGPGRHLLSPLFPS